MTLTWTTLHIAEVLARVSREIGKPEFSSAALEQICRKIWNESAVKLVEVLYTSCKPEDESLRCMIYAFDRNSTNLGSSVRCGVPKEYIMMQLDVRLPANPVFGTINPCDTISDLQS